MDIAGDAEPGEQREQFASTTYGLSGVRLTGFMRPDRTNLCLARPRTEAGATTGGVNPAGLAGRHDKIGSDAPETP
jgi:hypothetical protein